MSAYFGSQTDHFGLASADLVVIDSSETKIPQNRVNAQDHTGDIAASAYHGNTTQDMREVMTKYSLKSGSVNIQNIKLGVLPDSPTVARLQLEAATVNGTETPSITVTGRKNIVTPIAPDGKANTFILPSIVISGAKVAQQLSFATGAGCRLTGSTISATIELAQQDNGPGEPIAHGVSGGTGSISADFVAISAAPSWTVNAGSPNEAFGITETQPPGRVEGQAAFHNGQGQAEFTVLREDA